jgi:hypothetical protein
MMREVIINEESIKQRIKEHREEQEEKSREKIKEYFLNGQMNPEVTMFTLRLLGLTVAKAKELIKQWTGKEI